jgi:hypothetical protein
VLAYLRARALSRGFFGGSRVWVGIGAFVWAIRLFQWLLRPDTTVLYRDKLGVGQSVTIRHVDPPPTRRQRRKAKEQAARDAKQARKRARKQARKQGTRSARKSGRRSSGVEVEPQPA